jgi:hypothetical protein
MEKVESAIRIVVKAGTAVVPALQDMKWQSGQHDARAPGHS